MVFRQVKLLPLNPLAFCEADYSTENINKIEIRNSFRINMDGNGTKENKFYLKITNYRG